jgi:hypothetical protein
MFMEKVDFDYVVIGSGSAGVAVMSQLVKIAKEKKILWIDKEWNGGYLALVPQVPSNTTVELFLNFAKEIDGMENTEIYKEMAQLPQENGCKLGFVHKMLLVAVELLKKFPFITCLSAECTKIEKYQDLGWKVEMENQAGYLAKKVFLCIGSHKKPIRAPNEYSLEKALNGEFPPNLKSAAILGTSHSGMLVAMNLIKYYKIPELHLYFHISPKLKFAQRKYAEGPDLFINDNTGLKGEVAEWCKKHQSELEGESAIRIDQTSFQNLPSNTLKSFDAYDAVIFAVGFERNDLPVIVNGENLNFDNTGGVLAKDLYGFGIAFPEVVHDCDSGLPERAVGLWKCMKFVKKTIVTNGADF